MGVCDILTPQLPLYEDVSHTRVEWPWTYERVGCDKVFKSVASHRSQFVIRKVRLELEDSGCSAAGDHLVDCRVIERDVVDGGVFFASVRIGEFPVPSFDYLY